MKCSCFRVICKFLQRIYGQFERIPLKKRMHFLINIFIGILIMVAFLLLESGTWGLQNINMQFDDYIMAESKSSVNFHDRSHQSPNIVFFDIDNAAYVQWGRPDMVPRDKLARLVESAYEGEASVIVLDFDLARPDFSPLEKLPSEVQALDGRQRDDLLRKVLLKIKDQPKNTKVILAATAYEDGTLHKLLYGDLVDNISIFKASTNFLVNNYDQVARFWKPYDFIRENNEKPEEILWSIPVLATALQLGLREQLDTNAAEVLKTEKGNVKQVVFSGGQRVAFSFYTTEETPYQYNRIRYFFVPAGTFGAQYKGNLNLSGRSWSQGDFIPSKDTALSVKDKIVLIGNSSLDGGDNHVTPIGKMAGMYVHGNAINTLIHCEQPRIVGIRMHVLLEMLLTLLAAYIFLVISPGMARILISFGLVLLIPIGYYFFLKTGIFINFIFPLVGIGIHETVSRIEEWYLHRVMR